jgi:CDP-diacylglycerol--glycerol-3-phosphate 3-phosphatidyltransferase
VLTWDGYATVWAGLHGGADPRSARPAVANWLRLGYVLAKLAAHLRVPPGGVTALGIVACLFVPVTVVRGAGWPLLAALLVGVAAVADTVDGALAVLTDRTTRLGYVYDSIADRLGEACWLTGFYLLGVSGPVVVAVGALSWLHEYARSRANAAGMTEIGALTIGERPTRVALSFLGFALAGIPGAAGACVAVWGVLSLIGFGQLSASVHRALAGRPWPSWRRDGAPLTEAVARRVPPPDHAATTGPAPDAPEYVSAGHVGPGRRSDPIAELEFDLDPALRAELATLDELPYGTSIYVSSTAAEHAGRHNREAAPDETEPTPAMALRGRHVRPEDPTDDLEPPRPDGIGGLFHN